MVGAVTARRLARQAAEASNAAGWLPGAGVWDAAAGRGLLPSLVAAEFSPSLSAIGVTSPLRAHLAVAYGVLSAAAFVLSIAGRPVRNADAFRRCSSPS